ncbi:MAG: hypothetical protein D6731_24625 [Planctomycetota bacterium]|nr:MAG: hypothetical protein D6731_24625 [Planctomycetota bacterium]
MRNRILLWQALPAVLGFGATVVGCSGGGGGGAGSTAAGVRAGASWDPPLALSSSPSTEVRALEADGNGEVLVALPPQLDVLRAGPGGVSLETGLSDPPESLATVGGEVFAGTGADGVSGAADVYRRDVGGWQRVLDGAGEHMLVVALGADLYAFESSPGTAPTVHVLSSGQWNRAVVTLPVACLPQQALSDGTSLWVGAAPDQGDALLFQGDATGFQQLPLPSAMPAPNERERVTGLAFDDQGNLLVATALEDGSGTVLRGRVLVYDVAQQTFRQLADLNSAAPLALASTGSTVFVGTSAGRLLEGDSQSLSEDASVPANLGITRLLPDGGDLWVGVRTGSGAELLRRHSGTPAGGSGGGAVLGYADIKPSLAACAGCHSSLSTGFVLSAGLSDDAADFAAVAAQVDPQSPDRSPLLLKASAQTTHGGGSPWPVGSADYDLVLRWIQQGANQQGSSGASPATPAGGSPPSSGAAPPANGVKVSYLTHIKPLLGTCVGCHSSRSGYRLSAGLANDTADYQATLGYVNKAQPDASQLLRKTSGAVGHGGGSPWPAGSNAYRTVVLWIQQGAPYDGGTPAAAPTVPARPTYLDDVKPILSTCVGCHAKEDDMRLSPGLKDDTGDYRSVLGQVNLGTPARSGILRKATKQSGHPVKVFDVGSLPYQVLLKWIQTGAPYSKTSGPAPANLRRKKDDDD